MVQKGMIVIMKLKKWIAVLTTFCLAAQSAVAIATSEENSLVEGSQVSEYADDSSLTSAEEDLFGEELQTPEYTDDSSLTSAEEDLLNEELQMTEYEDNNLLASAETDSLPETLDYQDPQFIKDEVFFGKYNNESGQWIYPGYFDYERYPQLQMVKDAAQEGNYILAKALITEYYKEKAKTYNISQSGSASKTNVLIANMGVENMYANELSGASIIDIIKFNNTPSYVTTDVNTYVTTALTTGGKKLSIKMVALRKDGTIIDINSKESGINMPVLEIASKGVIKTIAPSKDTYISSGSNKSKNFGSETSIRLCESESSIGTIAATDENTARGWIQFDLDELSANDTISNATLKMYGSNVGAGDVAEVAIFRTTNTSWGETSMNWNSYPHYIYSYYGEDGLNYVNRPSDASNRYLEDVLRFEHGPRRLFSMYYHTDTPEYYAYYAFKQWGHFMKTTMLAGKGAGYNVGLDVSCRVAVANEIFNMINSKYMSDDLFVTTLKYFHEMGEWMYGHWTRQEQGGNWGTSQVSGQYNLYSKFYEFRRAENWLNDPANPNAAADAGAGPRSGINARLESQIEDLVQADGSYSECSLSYTKMTLNIYLAMKDVAEGANLGMPFSDNLISKIRDLGRYMMFTTMPGYRDNQVGNTSNYTVNYKSVLLDIGELTNDQELLYAGSNGKLGDMTKERSKLYDAAKRAMMRTGWNDNDLYLHVNTDGGQHSHGHHDDLSVSIYAKGNYLIADPLYHSYTDNVYDKELVSVKGHNTIEVDGKDQKGSGWYLSGERKGGKRGNIFKWETNESYDFFTGQTVNYDDDGVFPQRSILFIKPGYWIVSDYILPTDPSREHDYNQRWHMVPEAGITMDDGSKTARSNMEGSNIQVVPVDPQKYTSSTIEEGYYAGANRANYVMYSQNDIAGPTVFDTVLYPEDAGADTAITTESIAIDVENNDAVAMNISIEDRKENSVTDAVYYLVHNKNAIGERSIGEYTYDGDMLYSEKKGGSLRTRIFMQNATKLEENGTVIAKSNAPIEDIAVRYSGSKLYIDSSHITDAADELLKGFTVRKNRDVSTVLLNNKEISSAKQTANYVYFGDSPIIDEPASTPAPTPTNRPSGGGGGSHGGGGGGNITPNISAAPATPTPSPEPTEKPEITLTPLQEKELDGHWAKAEIEELIKASIVTGNESSSLELKKEITRAEYIVLLMRAINSVGAVSEDTKFSDVSIDDWYGEAVYRAAELGIVQGSGAEFRPNDRITREEMAVIAIRALGNKINVGEAVEFVDENEISDWALESVKKASAAGIILGDESKRFNPKNSALREQAFKVIYNIYKLM